jgi:uncharacterized protein (DUF362 family)
MTRVRIFLQVFSSKYVRFSGYIIGFAALIWFLIRVIPKPSRASYPCQRASFPIASAFVVWVVGILISNTFFKKAKIAFINGYKSWAVLFTFMAMFVFTFSMLVLTIKDSVYGAVDKATISRAGKLLYAREMTNVESIIEPKATVGIVKSDRGTAAEITFDDINIMIRNAVALAGGFDTLIHEGDLVVIKPNVIAARAYGDSYSNSFPQNANGIATDYRVIQVVVNMVREKNSSGKIIMIEGSGYGLTRTNMNAIGYGNITGLDSIICTDENIINWYDTTSVNLQKVALPNGKNLYSTANKYYLNKIYYHANVLISLPCLKSHWLTGITGSIKNVGIGATPVEMYGNGVSSGIDAQGDRENHINHGDYVSETIPLNKWIHDFYMCRPVNYVIMDGLQGAQYGPFPGSSNTFHALNTVQKNLRVVLAGKDPLAVDAIEALIAGFDPYLVGHLVLLANDTMGCINPAFIKVKGTQVHEIKTAFSEDMPGGSCRYFDFKGPTDATLTSCTIVNNEINISLIPGADITKVEVAYDDTILDPIVVNNFSSITLPINIAYGDANKVSLLLYDKYLNCSKLNLAHPTSTLNLAIKSFKLFPNPASRNISFDIPDYKGGNLSFSIYSTDGKLIMYKKIFNTNNQELDISGFKIGTYIVNLFCDDNVYMAKFNKI